MRAAAESVDSQPRIPLADLFPFDPCWRFGAIFSVDRRARDLRRENQRRHNNWLTGQTVTAVGSQAA